MIACGGSADKNISNNELLFGSWSLFSINGEDVSYDGIRLDITEANATVTEPGCSTVFKYEAFDGKLTLTVISVDGFDCEDEVGDISTEPYYFDNSSLIIEGSLDGHASTMRFIKSNSEATYVELSIDKTEIFSNGTDFAIIYVILKTENGQEVESDEITIYANGEKLESNKFSTNISGQYVIKAKHSGIFSNEITIVASPEVECSIADLEGTWSLTTDGESKGNFNVDSNGLVTLKPSGTYSQYIGNMFPNSLTSNIDGIVYGQQEHKDRYGTNIHTYSGKLNVQKNKVIGTMHAYQKDSNIYGGSESNITFNMLMEKVD